VLTKDGYTTVDVPGAFWTDIYSINTQGDIVGAFEDDAGIHGFRGTPAGRLEPDPGRVVASASRRPATRTPVLPAFGTPNGSIYRRRRGGPSSSASNAFASRTSAVSSPSVNQPKRPRAARAPRHLALLLPTAGRGRSRHEARASSPTGAARPRSHAGSTLPRPSARPPLADEPAARAMPGSARDPASQ
jgi:hypothetical protein